MVDSGHVEEEARVFFGPHVELQNQPGTHQPKTNTLIQEEDKTDDFYKGLLFCLYKAFGTLIVQLATRSQKAKFLMTGVTLQSDKQYTSRYLPGFLHTSL